MDITRRARNIIVHPALEWPIIDVEPVTVGTFYREYLVPLGLIGPIASFVGLTLIGISVPFVGTIRASFASGLTSAVVAFVGVLVGAYFWALIIDALAPTFGGRKDRIAALKVAIFAATPVLIAGILSLLPALGILQFFAGLYGLYLVYLGLPVLMRAPPEKAVAYTAVTVLAGIGFAIALAVLLTAFRMSPLGGVAATNSDEAVATNIASSIIGAAAGGTTESKDAAATIVASAIAAGKHAEAAANAARNRDAAAEGVAAIISLIGGGKKNVEPVPFAALKALLPTEIAPLRRTDASGETSVVAGVATSRSKGTYAADGGGRMTIAIEDMGNAAGVVALGKLGFSIESENDSGFEKNATLAGQRVHESWKNASKHSDLTAFIGNRFMIEVTGDDLMLPLAEHAFESIDTAALLASKR